MKLMSYDIEIANEIKDVPGGWGNNWGMGLGSVIVYSYDEDKYYEYLHNASRDEIKAKLNGNRVITFNGLNFDSKVLLGNKRILSPGPTEFSVTVTSEDGATSWVEFDIFTHCLKDINRCQTLLESTRKRSRGGNKLDDYALNTLGEEFGKTGHGKDAPIMYKNGEYEKLIEYNRQDVLITKLLFDFARKNGYLINGYGKRVNIQMRRS